jgi:hypothetical protein
VTRTAKWLALGVILLEGGAARAEELNWLGAKLPNGPGDPWPYHVDGRKPKPAGLPLSDVEAAIKRAYKNWQDVSCAYIELTYKGRDTSHGIRQGDGFNVMGAFLESKTEDRELYDNALGGGAALAVALPVYYGGTIYGCDIAYNAADYLWATDQSTNKFDVESVANQETGHCLGLDHHSGDVKSVMYPYVSLGDQRRTLQPHDVDNLCQLYPQSGQVGSACEGGACKNGLTCIGTGKTAYCTKGCDPNVANACPVGFSCKPSQEIPGSPGSCFFGGDAAILVGAPCVRGPDCGPGGVCFPYDPITDHWKDGYCSADCARNPCPANSSCFGDFSASGSKVCLKDCRPGFGDCRFDYSCEPLGSGRGRCVPSCHDDKECQGGLCRSCDGLCVRPGKPLATVGDPCSAHTDCPAGGVCRSDFPGGLCTLSCATKCTPCPQGSSCLSSGKTGELLCFKQCAAPSDCRGGFGCFQERGGSGCKAGCAAETDCPVGLICSQGSCVQRPGPDGGCALCNDLDATVLTPADAAVKVTPPPVGCGCTAKAGVFQVVHTFSVLVLFVRRRKGRAG